MSRTFVKQSQITGSAYVNKDATARAGEGDLEFDLNSLRSSIKMILGSEATNWYDNATQDLSAIYGALHVSGTNAEFQGDMVVTGALQVTGTSNFKAAVTVDTGSLTVSSGDVNVTGNLSASAGLQIGSSGTFGDALTVSSGNLTVSAGDVNVTGNLSASAGLLVGSSGTFGNALTVSSGDIKASSGYVSASTGLQTNGTLDVAGNSNVTSLSSSAGIYVSAGGIEVAGDTLDVSGTITLTGSMYAQGSATFSGNIDAATGSFGGDLNVTGSALIKGEATFSGSVKVASLTDTHVVFAGANGELTHSAKLTWSADKLTVDGDALITGDLMVQGDTTWIETDNLKVKDAFIHLATGSTGGLASGLVLHRGAGADDLVIGQSGGNTPVLFGKMEDTADVFDTTGSVDISAMELVGAAMLNLDFQPAADLSRTGSLSIGAAGFSVKAEAGALILGDSYKASSTYSGSLKLAASPSEWDNYKAIFNAEKSLLAAITQAASSSNFKKGVVAGDGTTEIMFNPTDKATNVHDVDIYLNGILMVEGDDYAVKGTKDGVDFNFNVNAADKVTYMIRNEDPSS